MKPLLLALVVAAVPWAAGPEKPRVSRAALANVERAFDQAFTRLDASAPYNVLGLTRGIYLAGYGAVFTSELDLVISPMPSPFVPPPSQADIGKLHERKLLRVNSLKASMKQMLIGAAAQLDSVPANEQIVFGVRLLYRSWEDRDNLPSQIIVQAPRQALLDHKAGRTPGEAIDAAIRVQELL